MRGLSPASKTSLKNGGRSFRLIKYNFSTALFHTDAPRKIVYAGDEYLPSAILDDLPDLSESIDMVPDTVTIPWSGVSLAEHALTVTEAYQNVEVTVYLHVEDTAETIVFWEGYIQDCPSEVNDKAGESVINWKVASHWANWQAKNGRVLSREGQQEASGNPSDKFFQYIGVTDDRLEDWEHVNEGLTGNSLVDGVIDAGVGIIETGVNAVESIVDGISSLFGGGGGGGGGNENLQTAIKQLGYNLVKYPSQFRRLPVLYGTTRTPGVPVFRRIDENDTQFLYVVYALGEGECESLENITFKNDESYTSGNYSGKVSVIGFYSGAASQTADPTLISKFPSLWSADHVGDGVCYVVMRYKKSDVWSGEPKPAFIVKGKKLFDPRTSLTQWSANAALITRDYITDPLYGRGLPISKIDDTAFIDAANDCDVQITNHDGTGTGDNAETPASINQFEINGAILTDKSVKSNLEAMLFNMRAYLPRIGGKHTLIRQQAGETAVYDLDGDNTTGLCEVAPVSAVNKKNVVFYEIIDPRINYRKGNFKASNDAYLAEDKYQVSEKVVTNILENDRYRALRHADVILNESRTGVKVQDTATEGDAIDLAVGDIVRLSRDEKGWVQKPFRVMKTTVNTSNQVKLVLKAYVSANHNTTVPGELVPANDSILYSPFSVEAITDIAFTSGTSVLMTLGDGTIISQVKGVIPVPVDQYVTGYIVEYKLSTDANYSALKTLHGRTNNEFYLSPANDGLTYDFKVTAFNAFGRKSTAFTKPHTVVGKTEAPAAPSALTATSETNAVRLDWVNPSPADLDFLHVEIEAATSNNQALAEVIATVKAETYTHPTTTDHYYWIVIKDTSKNLSDFYPLNPVGGVLGSPDPVAAGDLSGTVDWSSQIDGAGKPADNADVTNYSDYRVTNSQTENNVLTIAKPQGASYSNNTSSVVGAIVIALPQSWTSTMMKMVIDVFEYASTASFSIAVGGYNYSASSQWVNEFAQLFGNTQANNRVRFGHNGTNCCIVIGETTTSWAYPKIAVRDFVAGHSNFSQPLWATGWAISIVSNLSGYTFTGDFADTLLDAKSIINQGALATQNENQVNALNLINAPAEAGATNTTNTSQLVDGAQLGLTAEWAGVVGSGKPADNATNGAQVDSNLTDSAGNPIDAVDYFSNTGLFYRVDILTLDGYITSGATLDPDGVLVTSVVQQGWARHLVKPVSTRIVPINFDKKLGFKTRIIIDGMNNTFDEAYIGLGSRYTNDFHSIGMIFEWNGTEVRAGVYWRRPGTYSNSALTIGFNNGDDLTIICVRDDTGLVLDIYNNTTQQASQAVFSGANPTGGVDYEMSIFAPDNTAGATTLMNEWFVFQAP